MRWSIMGLLLAVYLFETGVTLLNRKNSLKPVPERIQDVYDRKRYEKWLTYSQELNHFSLWQRGFDLAVLLFLLNGVFPRLAEITSGWTVNSILQTLLFLGVYLLVTALLDLPFSLYRTFSIEERHGFNRTTPGTFWRDSVLNLVLTAVLGGLFIAGLQDLYLRFAHNLWLFIFSAWAAASLVMVLIFAFLNKLFLRLFNKFSPLPHGDLRTRIEDLAASLGFNVKAISIMDASRRSTKLNAFFSGVGKNKEVVLFDTLMEKASDDQIVSVLGHELGHAVHKDTWRMVGFQIAMIGLFSAGVGLILENEVLFSAFGFPGIHFGFAVLLFSVLFRPLHLILGLPINSVMRSAEYRADRFSAQHTETGWLVSALKVLSRENLANLNPHPLYVKLYYSHPPLNERIRALER